ncbi:hypothetical protein QC762_610650 [Podospora pseudocomata]|uniref:Uncharacterized protein n=4 Tax=Podospora TaxID=5144 RepID=A0ABR0H6N8_9PEZI|nr:hypothetical protein QC761_610650 [Podospora bellae-mahoneyi]KAK4652380.1 hypothetical protein QC762_610650 [Podospora pseudocomata]KAK4663691.1 hypothetical protein QC763_610650 [Podospora pseudopauciseta]KAK4672003.1 hypothetical protein QC764_610650 [Podospora pseudoanserina]
MAAAASAAAASIRLSAIYFQPQFQ